MSWLNVKHAMDLSPWIRIPLMWPEPGLEDVEEAQTPEAWARYFAEGLWEGFESEVPQQPFRTSKSSSISLIHGKSRFLRMSTWWRSRRAKTGQRHYVS